MKAQIQLDLNAVMEGIAKLDLKSLKWSLQRPATPKPQKN